MLRVTPELTKWLIERGAAENQGDDYYKSKIEAALDDGSLTFREYAEMTESVKQAAIDAVVEKVAEKLTGQKGSTTMNKAFTGGSPNPAEVFGGGIRVKAGSEAYCTTKSVGKHIRTGLPVCDERGREVQTSSQLERAKLGAWMKYLAGRCGAGNVHLTEHDKSLVNEILEKDTFCGHYDGDWQTGIPGLTVKALLADSTSGGVEVVPEWFDDMLVTFPLLHSELLPMVTIRPVPRGKTVEGASVGNPTVDWGTAEGTAIGLFNTDDLISGIDTTIHPVTCAVEVGRDFLADAAAGVGAVIEEVVGQRMLSELDRVIAVGDGVTEPTGITIASGLIAATAENAASGPPTVADYEELIFSVGKQYRNPAMRCAFLANDTVYSRARGIAVGGSDQRRVFGMDHQSYQLLEYPFKVQNDIANTKIVFGAMSRYRLYRRQGAETQWETTGASLARSNTNLLIVRGRFGGQVVDASAFAMISNAKS